MPVTTLEFYRHYFPWDSFVGFLTRHGEDHLCKREFAIEGAYYKRYVVANDAQQLKEQVLKMPGLKSLHIGPVYNERVVRASSNNFSFPIRREFVCDIDLDDYCYLDLKNSSGNLDLDACDAAWPVCSVGIFILQYLLKSAFGFSEFVVVYSGRRGVHLHVCDDAAMNLGDDARGAITDYLQFSFSEDKFRANQSIRSVVVAQGLLDAVHHAFEKFFVDGMRIFETAEARVAFVERLGLSDQHLPAVSNLVEDVLDLDGLAMWDFVKTKVKSLPHEWMKNRLDEMVLFYVWPRIDAGVSRRLNHLLKAPFVVHPKTNRVACPIDAADYFRFNPAKAPCLDTLLGNSAASFANATVHWLRPCHVVQNKKKKNPKKTQAEDIDMEDLAGASASASKTTSKLQKRKFLPKKSQLSKMHNV